MRLTCREVTDFLMDYVSGDLPLWTRAKFEFHLQICSNCRTYLQSYRDTIALGKAAFDDPETPAGAADVPEDLVKAILAARRTN